MASLDKLGPGLLTLGETGSPQEFGALCSSVALAPDYDSDDPIDLLDGSAVAGEESETWKLTPTIYQDYQKSTLLLWLYKNSGKEVPFTFVPSKEGALQAKGKVKVRAASIGGDVKKRNTSELEMPVVGRPILTDDYAPVAGPVQGG